MMAHAPRTTQGGMPERLRTLLVALLLTLALGASACGAQEATPTPAAPAQPAPVKATPTPASGDESKQSVALPASELGGVYELVLQRYVDRVDHEQLIAAARNALRDALLKDKALPLDTEPVDALPGPTDDAERDWAAFASAYSTVVTKHFDWANRVRPDVAILHAMLDSLSDSHTSYIEAEQAQRKAESSYTGIGVRLSKPGAGLPPMVVEVFPNSPAERAGLHAGDRLISVQGKDVTALDLNAVADAVRGPEGTTVQIGVERGNDTSPQMVEVPRAQLQIQPVDARIGSRGNGPRIAYLRIRQFSDEVPMQVAQALAGMLTRGGAKGIVLDLRGNGGGSLRAVATVAGFFVDSGKPIGIEIDRARRKTPLNAEGTTPIRPLPPVAVLVDNGTASGSEILAAALKEYGLATLVGNPTAGSVAVAEVQTLSDGSQVQITVHRFVSPSGAQIDRVGVQPDEKVDLTPADLEAGRDPQLERAFDLIEKKLNG